MKVGDAADIWGVCRSTVVEADVRDLVGVDAGMIVVLFVYTRKQPGDFGLLFMSHVVRLMKELTAT